MATAGKFDFDVFISYSHVDEAWVRGELLPRIEEAGLKAFIDYRDFTRGAPSIKEMERGVVRCRKTLLVLTPDYVASEWCEIENIMAAVLGPANRDLRTLPLLKAECEKPLRIAALTHIDFTDAADHELAWRQLLTALGKRPEPEPPAEPQHDEWLLAHPYPMPPNFTGRVAERQMLNEWLNADAGHPLLSLRALGGFGKSALVWHWLTHDVTPDDWPRVVWWSFYEGDANFDAFLVESLEYLNVVFRSAKERTFAERKATNLTGKEAVRSLLKLLHEPGTLLVLDGFERVLRAFGGLDAAYQGDEARREDNDRDCISPLTDLFLRNIALQPNLRSKVLLTTRLTPRAIEARGGGLLAGCREQELREMQPADAVAYFEAQGIRGTHTEIESACEPYGYHPLSLCLLAGVISEDLQQPGDIAAARRLDVGGDLKQRQHHVLEVAYDSLGPEAQMLLGRIACFRSPVAHETLRSLAEREPHAKAQRRKAEERQKHSSILAKIFRFWRRKPLRLGAFARDLDADLHDLIARGLLHHDRKENRFDLHPIVRRYAYDRLAAPDRAAAHTQLRDYFAAVPEPERVTSLEDLAAVIELYHHTVRTGQLDEARRLFRDRLATPLYFQLGAYQLQIDLLRPLFPDGEDRPPRLKDEAAQAWTLNALANSYSLSGQPRRAVPLFEQSNEIYENQGDKSNLAIGLGNVATQQLVIGELRAAEANLRRRIELCREIEDEFNEAIGHHELGRLLAYRGAYAESETELATALKMDEKRNDVQGQGVTWAYRALGELLRLRLANTSPQRQQGTTDDSSLALRVSVDSGQRALELADETANDSRFVYPVRDYVRAHWLLGAAYRVSGQPDEAERHLHEALERCRRINLVDHEADILIDLARLCTATGQPDEAQRLADEALLIADRSGYVLQAADAHLELARLALARGDKPNARQHAEAALANAACDGPPDWTYKAAYTEATALLKQLK